jgi:hypothetical protein
MRYKNAASLRRPISQVQGGMIENVLARIKKFAVSQGERILKSGMLSS